MPAGKLLHAPFGISLAPAVLARVPLGTSRRKGVWLCTESVCGFAPLPLLTVAGGCDGGTSVEDDQKEKLRTGRGTGCGVQDAA